MRVHSLYGMMFADIACPSALSNPDKQDLFMIETEDTYAQYK